MTNLYRSGVGAIIINQENKVFIGKRIRTLGEKAWQMPQGGIDGEETPEEALKRELFEETGITTYSILAKTSDWIYYDLPGNLPRDIWGGKYKGQKQIWYLIKFDGKNNEININAHNPPEFSEWRWEEPDNLLDLIIEFKRDMYKKVLEELLP